MGQPSNTTISRFSSCPEPQQLSAVPDTACFLPRVFLSQLTKQDLAASRAQTVEVRKELAACQKELKVRRYVFFWARLTEVVVVAVSAYVVTPF